MTEAIYSDKNGAPLTPEQVRQVHGYVPVTREEFERVATQVAEIHAIVDAFAKALEDLQNHPMISAMLPRM